MLRRLHFNAWYFFRPPWDSGISPPELFDFIAKHPAGRAVDLGCGTGTNSITLAQHGWEVVGVDFARQAIRAAERKARSAQVTVRFLAGDVTRLDGVSGRFDLALDLGCFHGLPDRQAYLFELDRLLHDGGYWLMYGLLILPGQTRGPGLDAVSLDLILSQGFELITRTDGVDRRDRPSAWFLYQKPRASAGP